VVFIAGQEKLLFARSTVQTTHAPVAQDEPRKTLVFRFCFTSDRTFRRLARFPFRDTH
jgi:hypothetical protein